MNEIDQLLTAVNIELLIDMGPMGMHRARADEQTLGNSSLGEALSQQLQHVGLAVGKAAFARYALAGQRDDLLARKRHETVLLNVGPPARKNEEHHHEHYDEQGELKHHSPVVGDGAQIFDD